MYTYCNLCPLIRIDLEPHMQFVCMFNFSPVTSTCRLVDVHVPLVRVCKTIQLKISLHLPPHTHTHTPRLQLPSYNRNGAQEISHLVHRANMALTLTVVLSRAERIELPLEWFKNVLVVDLLLLHMPCLCLWSVVPANNVELVVVLSCIVAS